MCGFEFRDLDYRCHPIKKLRYLLNSRIADYLPARPGMLT